MGRLPRTLLGSAILHLGAVVAMLCLRQHANDTPPTADIEIVVVPMDDAIGGGGHGVEPRSASTPAIVPVRSATKASPRAVRRHEPRGWDSVTVRDESPGGAGGGGIGFGTGGGPGPGLGLGSGRGPGAHVPVRDWHEVPLPPPPPPPAPVSKARPAKLIFPTRDRDVEDEGDLFIARITVDAGGDVIGARMVRTHPGSRGEQAANAIWTFRYLPALDDAGSPTRSTFEQPYQIR